MQTTSTKAIDCIHYIDGAYVSSGSGRTFDNVNPATEEVLGTVAEGNKEEVDQAVSAARQALNGEWGKMPLKQKSKIIRKIGDLILERKEELAELESLDTGKPIWLSNKVDIDRAANNFYFFADYMTTVGTEAYQQDDIAIHYAVRRPVGVVGLINPWNLPLFLMTWKLAPALAAGNTAVMKPSEVTPMTATVLAQICKDAGVPDGVVNVVHGFGETGAALSSHEDVDAIAFTGETVTGSAIMKAASPTLKKLSFELGGKNPNIIFADADMEDVIETTIKSSFINQGEVCLCGSRIYVERSAYEEFLEKFTAKTKELKVGDPFDPDTNVGALVSKEHFQKVTSYLDIAKEEGGTFLTGGKVAEGFDKGFFVEPTIITGLGSESRCVREEIFGPVVTVVPFDTEMVGMPSETALAAGSIIMSGMLDKYPDLKLCFAHGGGALPYLLPRMDKGWEVWPHIRKTEKPPSEYAKHLFYDSLVYDEDNLQFMIDKFGVDRIIAGSDYPFLLREAPSGAVVERLSSLDDIEKGKILGFNALEFLNLDKEEYKASINRDLAKKELR